MATNNSANSSTNNSANMALLIDGDNVSPKIVAGLMAEIANYGTASVRRIYGDWTTPSLKGWKKCLLDYSILPIQQFAYTQGKSSTDGAMIIDAMDLLYTGGFSSFCIVSSDSDFTRLAARIREQGVTVYGFGERKTNSAFIAACDKFVYFDVLDASAYEPKEQPTPQFPTTEINPTPELRPHSQLLARAESPKQPLDEVALTGLTKAIQLSNRYDGNFANLADVGLYLSRISPDLNARNYGYQRLREFVTASGIVELKWKQTGGNPPVALVRLKEHANIES
jgi:uncharacterized LabA/DUF88 family protein